VERDTLYNRVDRSAMPIAAPQSALAPETSFTLNL
jgi:hypothetical protein